MTMNGDCGNENKRHLLLGRKAMTNRDSTLKSRAITLLTKALIVKALVFPTVMYSCESWISNTTEHWRAGEVSGTHSSTVNEPIISLVMLCHLHAKHCTRFRAAESEEETCVILYDITQVPFTSNMNERRCGIETNSGLGASLEARWWRTWQRRCGHGPGSGRSSGGGSGNPLQCSCLEDPMDRGAWQASVHGVTKSWTRLSSYREGIDCSV